METKRKVSRRIRQYIFITIGVILTDLAFFFFYDPLNLVVGGITGLSIIFKPLYTQLSWFKVSYFLYIVDILLLVISLFTLGKEFFIKTIYASILGPTVVLILELTCDPNYFLASVESKYIVATVIGGILMGLGVGLAIKNNGSTGGMDIVQKIMSKYLKMPLSRTMYFTDWVIVLAAGFIVNGKLTGNYAIEPVMYGILGVIAIGFIVDYLALDARNRRTIYCITEKPDEVKELIYKSIDRGVTFSKVTGAYTNEERVMVICTMDKNEAYRMSEEIAQLDPKSFSFVTSCKEVRGEYTRKGIL